MQARSPSACLLIFGYLISAMRQGMGSGFNRQRARPELQFRHGYRHREHRHGQCSTFAGNGTAGLEMQGNFMTYCGRIVDNVW
jgi:hypothetical protein